jgi:hypothetical protein
MKKRVERQEQRSKIKTNGTLSTIYHILVYIRNLLYFRLQLYY